MMPEHWPPAPQETRFILEKAGLFGTRAGEVYQVNTAVPRAPTAPAAGPRGPGCQAPPPPPPRPVPVQVIDVAAGSLQNVITFPPEGAFIVDSSLEVEGRQRMRFAFRSSKLKLPSRDVSLPPFGKGW
jgi:hypothetical protein